MNPPSFHRRALALLLAAFATLARTAAATPETSEPRTAALDVLESFGLQHIVYTDPVAAMISRGDTISLDKAFAGQRLTAFPFSGLSPLQLAAMLGRVDMIDALRERGAAVDERSDERMPTALHLALLAGHEPAALALLQRGADARLAIGQGMTALPLAALMGFTEVLAKLETQGLPLDAPGVDGMTPLAVAVQHGQRDAATWLLARGAAAGATNRYGATLLHLAARGGHAALIPPLLESGADPRAFDRQDRTALMDAVRGGHLAAVGALALDAATVNQTNRHDQTAVTLAIEQGSTAALDMLIAGEADLAWRDARGETLMHRAVRHHHPEVIAWLARRNVDVNARTTQDDGKGETPLLLAVSLRQAIDIPALMQAGADAELAARDGFTPLLIAIHQQDHAIVRHLLEGGANANTPLPDGQTPLMRAAYQGDTNQLALLLQYGAEINDTNEKGATALHYTTYESKLANLAFLLDRGADPSLPRGMPQWPVLHQAAWQGKIEFVALLLDRGVDPDFRHTLDEETTLMLAARQGHLPVVRLLLDRGADPARRASGLTAWHCAVTRQHPDVAALLASRMSPADMAPTNLVPVYFELDDPYAKRVSVAGEFNNWNPESHPLRRRDDDGWWYAEIDLFPYPQKYKFVVDNNWIVDPANGETMHDPLFGAYDSVVQPEKRHPADRPRREPSRIDDASEVTFNFHRPGVQAVSVAGEFNAWNPKSLPMHYTGEGRWSATALMKRGEYGYKLVVDGAWLLDPANAEVKVVDGVTNSLLRVIEKPAP